MILSTTGLEYRTTYFVKEHSTNCKLVNYKLTQRQVWLNGWVFVYELSGSGFESSCSHLDFRFRACFEQGVPWHSSNYREWIHSETLTWHDKYMQSIILSIYKLSELKENAVSFRVDFVNYSLIWLISLLKQIENSDAK